MNQVQSTQSTCLHRDFTSLRRRFLNLLPGMCGRGAMLCLVCLVLLPGFPAKAQSDDRLSPGDRIELRVWRWTALRDGAVEGLQLNRSFSIDATGTLDLPNIGSIAAAGLRADELARLIADRLQARSGGPERPDTTVQRMVQPAAETTASVEPTGDKAAPEPSAVAEVNGSASAPERAEIENGPGAATVSEPPISGELAPKAAQEPRQTAQTLPGGHEEETLRRELAAARAALDVMQRGARDASAQARAVADTAARQGQALEEQRQTAEAQARDLEAARHVIEGFKTKAIIWNNQKATMLKARHAADASQAAADQALAEERQKVELLEQELAASRQTIGALEMRADEAAAGQAGAMKDRQMAEAAAKQAGAALALERQRADAAARDLDAMRKERDASQQAAAALSAALEQERERSIGLARGLSAARGALDIFKARARTVSVKRAPKALISPSPLATASGRSVRKQLQKSAQLDQAASDVVATIALPAALLPTRPPKLDPRW
ncbi:polysaccharide biosynthesis/export family protein [Mesorhizobium sp. WSM4884]|uniref:polysaccharide biosynthesis/export family protein n=1 Tax=Mesorhizobium sp. WSM4884 TaxID=3038542 RepID=UPI002417FF22|nr:polysaccharide biosynthesis/export family protein [Mesorhizobium sp. WSM4884]MDG4883043.1 polysaccharide biosynthesis/export family protein [Mesorhizobium sp. WSM4884]